MICYQCGSVLGSGRHCLHCGANIAVYRKIVRSSNAFYNAGLEKARVRDLGEAAAYLRRALEYDKKNVKARNLLGLVYYEMGEMVDALSQWVVSKNIQPKDNPAEYYISEIQDDKHGFEAVNQAVKKYNLALESARHDGEDLAIIQLRSVISMHPKFLKAYQLLALLLLKNGDISKAAKVIKRGLQIDKGNVTLLRYQKETKGKIGYSKAAKDKLIDMTRDIAGQDVVVPQYVEKSRTKQLLLGAGICLVICLAAYFILIKPSIKREASNSINQNAISYYEKIEDKDSKVELLRSQLEEIQTELEADKKQMEVFTADDGSITNYERILTALNQVRDSDYTGLLETYTSINPDVITTEAFIKAYEYVGSFVGSDTMLSGIMTGAIEAFNAGKYQECQKICQQCLDVNENFAEALYYMGLSYEARGDDASAAPYFKTIVEKFPSSQYFELAKKRTS